MFLNPYFTFISALAFIGLHQLHIMLFIAEINECESNPCLNNGECNDFLDGFNCTCATGYEGVNCNIGMIYFLLIENDKFINYLKV